MAEVARAAVAALGIENGPSYTQLRVGADGPQVIEVAARLGGGHDAELVEAVTGVDLNGLAIDAALGEPRSCRPGTSARVGGAVTRFLVAPPGVLERSRCPAGLDGRRARSGSTASRATSSRRCGAAPTAPARCSRVGDSRDEALARADAAADRIRFVTADAGALLQDELTSSRSSHRRSPRRRSTPSPETLRSGWLTTGPRTAELEARMRDYLEAKHVLAVSSCTAALHLSLVALGVGPGDEVITTSITWPATANVIVHCGATPVFADVRDDTLNIDPEHVRALVNERTKAIVPVDLYGQPADLDALRGARPADRRGRRARGRVALPRPQGRRRSPT